MEDNDNNNNEPNENDVKKPGIYSYIIAGFIAFMLIQMFVASQKATEQKIEEEKRLAYENRVVAHSQIDLAELKEEQFNGRKHYVLKINKDGNTVYLKIVNTSEATIINKVSQIKDGAKVEIALSEVNMLTEQTGTISEKYVRIVGDDAVKVIQLQPDPTKGD